MRNLINIILSAILLTSLLGSCQSDDYKNDGGILDPHVDMTTYDYLKSNPKFDSLVRIIDKAGMKDAINGNITFFATTNYGVADYVSAKKQKKIIETGSENIDFGIKDLNPTELADSLKMYMFPGLINREQLTTDGAYFEPMLSIPNTRFYLGLRRTRDYDDYLDYVDYLYYMRVIGTKDTDEPDQDDIPDDQRDNRVDVQTSGIITTTGILHVLASSHTLFFNNEPRASN